MEMKKPNKTIRELERRGYEVTNRDGNLEVKCNTFWGSFNIEVTSGKDNSKWYWPRSIMLGLFPTYAYWLWKKNKMRDEVLGLTKDL